MPPSNRFALVATTSITMALAARPAEPTPPSPTVFLNHFFVVIDPKSYQAMLADPYLLGTFAPFEKRTTVRNDQSYTGAYWYGRRTYFEVFEPPSQGPAGASGMAFSVDGAGESAAVKDAWTASLGSATTAPVTRRTETAEPAWFHMTAAGAAAAGFRLWLMEYDRDFLARWYPELTPARGITRGEVLDRYVAKIGRSKDRETAALGDIKGLVLALDDHDRELLRKHALPAGWTAKAGNVPETITLTGPESVTLEVTKATEARRGIIEARFSVQGKPRPHSASLGSVRLTVEPTGARLRFVP